MVTINRCNTEIMVYFIRVWFRVDIFTVNVHRVLLHLVVPQSSLKYYAVGKPKFYLESRSHRNFDAFNGPILKCVFFSKESMLVLFLCVEPMQILLMFPEHYSFFSLHGFLSEIVENILLKYYPAEFQMHEFK